MSKRKIALWIDMLLVPVTVLIGYFCFHDKKYYFISALLVVEALVSIMLLFENRQAKLSEILTIAVMSALAAMSRVAFYAVPEIKPMLSLVIISGIVFGKESALMIGMLRKFCLQHLLWSRTMDTLANVCYQSHWIFIWHHF